MFYPACRVAGVVILAALFLGGCGEIYEKIYDKPHTAVRCLKIEADEMTRYILLQNPKLRALSAKECPFILRATSHYVAMCTSAQARALGSDFDGFLRLELFEKGRLLYRVQRDFKGCLRERIVASLMKRVEQRIGI